MKQQGWPRRSRWLKAAGGIIPAVVVMALTIAARPQERAAALPPAADTTVITIRSTSAAMAFDPDEISVKQGTPVRIHFVNESTFPHHIVVVKSEDDIDLIGAASARAAETGFVPVQFKSRIIAYSAVVSPGRSVDLSFVAPPAGEYPFVCFVEGHYNMMIGKLRSRK